MASVKVFRVKLFDYRTDQSFISPRMAPPEGAKKMKGTIIEDTGIDIDASQLEDGEQWTPSNFTPYGD